MVLIPTFTATSRDYSLSRLRGVSSVGVAKCGSRTRGSFKQPEDFLVYWFLGLLVLVSLLVLEDFLVLVYEFFHLALLKKFQFGFAY